MEQKVIVGSMMFSTIFDCNVTVKRVYKNTATVECWGKGLKEGKLMTFRGHDIGSLKPKR